MTAVTTKRTFARVDDDLERGDVAMARTRLKSLLISLPQSLEARERLGDLYRREGDRVEAGRWSYLSEQRDLGETTAFERACGGNPVRIMRGLRWQGSEDDATTEVARERLLDVRTRAEAAAGKKLEWSDRGREVGGSTWDDVVPVGCLLVALVLLFLVVVGAVTVLGWIF